MELLPDFRALLSWFRAAGLLSSNKVTCLARAWEESPQARRAVEAVRGLRERLRTEVLAWERNGTLTRKTIDELNRLMAEHPMLARLNPGLDAPSIELWFDPRQPQDLRAPLAHAAAQLFAHAERQGVRKCGHCVLHFYDTSKKGTRRWCSMRLCGNRLKVAAYAVRQRVRGA